MWDIGIGERAASARSSGWLLLLRAEGAAASQATGHAHLKYRRLVEVDGQLVAVAIGDRAPLVSEDGAVDAAARLQLARGHHGHPLDQPVVNGDCRIAPDRDEKPSLLDEALQIDHALQFDPPADVIGLIGRRPDVRRQLALLPGDGIAALGDAIDDRLRAARRRPQDDHVVFGAQIRRIAQDVYGDVVVGELQAIEGEAEPSLVLRVRPRVHERDARDGDLVRGDFRQLLDGVDCESQIRGRAFEPGAQVR